MSPETIKKFKLEDTLVKEPEKSCAEAQLLLVVQDVSNRYVRESLDKRILQLLCHHNKRIPAILVLNKIDSIPKSRRLFDLIRKLTCNRIEGEEGQVKISKTDSKWSVETYLKRKERHLKGEEGKGRQGRDWDHVLEVSRQPGRLSEEETSSLLAGLVGWPGFRDVFTTSALQGDGVSDLREYLLDQAQPGTHKFHSSIKTDASPEAVAVSVVKSRLLANMHFLTPYKLKPLIELWLWEPEREVLDILMSVEAENKWEMRQLVGDSGATLRRITQESEQCLQSYFSHNVHLKLEVKQKFTLVTHEPAGHLADNKKSDLFL